MKWTREDQDPGSVTLLDFLVFYLFLLNDAANQAYEYDKWDRFDVDDECSKVDAGNGERWYGFNKHNLVFNPPFLINTLYNVRGLYETCLREGGDEVVGCNRFPKFISYPFFYFSPPFLGFSFTSA